MLNFKKFFLTENIYRDKNTGHLIYKVNPKEAKKLGDTDSGSNEQLVAKEVFIDTTVKGNMSTYIPTKQARMFIGYDVYTTTSQSGKDIRNSVYGAVKGTSNTLKNKTYEKDFQAMSREEYEMLINRAVDAFVSKTTAPYDYILYPSSRSSHANDIADAINEKLKVKFTSGALQQRVQSTKVQLIPKKFVTPETMKEVVHIDKLVNIVYNTILKKAEVSLSDDVKAKVIDLLTNTLTDKLHKKALSAGKDTPFSTATHLRSTPNSILFKDAIDILNAGSIAPELHNKLQDISIGGHLDDYCDSHFDLTSLKQQLEQYVGDTKSRQWIGKMRVLIVDDNINSGDMYKQIAPLDKLLVYCDYFFLMKDLKFKI